MFSQTSRRRKNENGEITSQTSPPSPDPPSSDTTSASGISSCISEFWDNGEMLKCFTRVKIYHLTSPPAPVLASACLARPLPTSSPLLRPPVRHLCPGGVGHQLLYIERSILVQKQTFEKWEMTPNKLLYNLIPRPPPIPIALLARAPRWGRIDFDSAWQVKSLKENLWQVRSFTQECLETKKLHVWNSRGQNFLEAFYEKLSRANICRK